MQTQLRCGRQNRALGKWNKWGRHQNLPRLILIVHVEVLLMGVAREPHSHHDMHHAWVPLAFALSSWGYIVAFSL